MMNRTKQLEDVLGALRKRVAPPVGPDMASASPAGFGLNWKPEGGGGGAGAAALGAAGLLASALINRKAQQKRDARASSPSPGANLTSPDYGSVDFFAGGGTLRRDGQVAVVGEEGPEVAVKRGDETHIIPLDRLKNVQDAGGALSAPPATRPRTVGPPTVAEPATRPRVADPVGHIGKQIDYETANPAQDTNGRGRSMALGALIGALEGAKSGDWKTALASAGVGAAAGAIDKSFDEKTKQSYRVAGLSERLGGAMKRRKNELELAGEQSALDLSRARTRQVEEETRLYPEKVRTEMAGKAQTRLLQQLRIAGRYKRGENTALDGRLDDAGLMVSDFEKGGKIQWKEAGGQVYLLDDKTGHVTHAAVGGEKIEDASKKPGADGLTPSQARLATFRETKLFKELQERKADRQSREKIAANAQAGADRRSAAAQSGADRRIAASIAAANSRAGRKDTIALSRLALQAEQEGQELEKLVNEARGFGYEVDPDQ